MSLFSWFKRERETPKLLDAVVAVRDSLHREFAELRNTVESAIKTYKCIICGTDFARLPRQSDRRCPACQREIKATASPSVAQGNSGHRSAGHSTRGIHKKTGPTP